MRSKTLYNLLTASLALGLAAAQFGCAPDESSYQHISGGQGDPAQEIQVGKIAADGFGLAGPERLQLNLDVFAAIAPGRSVLGGCAPVLSDSAVIGRLNCELPETLAGQSETLVAGQVRQFCTNDSASDREPSKAVQLWDSGCQSATVVRVAKNAIPGAVDAAEYTLNIAR